MYRRKDGFYKKAKAEGYRSRAAYKLEELARRQRLFRRGDHVIDLGCWPGGWLQVAARNVGPGGRVVGIDLRAVEGSLPRNVAVLEGDVRDERVRLEAVRLCGGRVDVVLSDMAPQLTGVSATDQARSAELVREATRFARSVLGPGGRYVVKVLQGDETPALVREIRDAFERVRIFRPEASRKGSAETYVIASLGPRRV